MQLLILDGNSVINRAYFGVRPLTTRDGLYTHAIYGFLNILEKMRKEECPDAVCVAFDLHGPTFRHLKYDGYKATRHGMPEELAQQMPVMKQVLAAMNIPIYECQGWEADDVIGTVAKTCGTEGWDCVIVTGDRDSLQLIDGHVRVKLVITKGGQTTATLYDEDLFREEYGFAPKKLIDLKALMGDSSDNIPGVAGVGPKTAKELLTKFGSLDGVYAHLEDPSIRPKLREKLETGKESAYLSYDLATIRPEAPIAFAPEDATVREPNRKALLELFTKLEFQKLIDRYGLRGADLEPEAVETPAVYEGSCTMEMAEEPRVKALLDQMAAQDHVSVAVSEDLMTVAVEGCGQATVFAKSHLGEAYLPALARLFSPEISKFAHDTKPLMRRLLELGLPAEGFSFDTAVAAYLLDATRGSYDLGRLTQDYLHFDLPAPQTEDPEAALAGALASRAAAVEALYGPLLEKLREQGSDKVFFEMDLPLCPVLARMEHTGVLVDSQALDAFSRMLSERIAACEDLIFGYSGGPFNINSTRQLGQLLFETLGLPPVKKTKTGYSTNVEVLEKLKDKHPVVPAIMDYRMLTKLKSTYADGLMKVIGPDGRIRTTFQNLVTATGRLSSTDPNLQNIPVRTDLGAEIRKMFVPGPGCVLVDADYSQIELRVLSHIADDKTMQEAFRSGLDIHTATAAQVFGVAPEQVTPLQRRHAKAVNFGIVYGISEFSLAEDIGVSRWEAREYIDNYLANYHGVLDYMKRVVEEARESGFTQTLYGRRRYLPELKSSNYNIRQGAERMALNTPIQGTAADIIKLAMIRVDKALRERYPEAKLLLQVHDELIVECPEAIAPQVAQLVSREMEQVAQLKVPLTADAKWGGSWYEAK